MAAPTAIVQSSNDSMDAISVAEEFLMFDDENDGFDLDNLLSDPLMNECNGNVAGNSEAGPSGVPVEENIHENGNSNDVPQGSNFGNPMRISVWPVLPSPYCCTCCQTLREIFHINGTLVNKLEIHGRLGIISHAVLDIYNSEFSPQNHEYHMFDFCNETISSVKQFLVQYCDDRKREGYIMLQDPLSNFYAALCTGLDDNGNLDNEIFSQQTRTGSGDSQINQQRRGNQPEDESLEARLSKSHFAVQRERAGNMGVKDLAGYFHLPIRAASKEINICQTAMKKICRKGGMPMWPHRKVALIFHAYDISRNFRGSFSLRRTLRGIKSIQKQISERRKSLNSNDVDEKARALAEIQTLERTLASFGVAYHQ